MIKLKVQRTVKTRKSSIEGIHLNIGLFLERRGVPLGGGTAEREGSRGIKTCKWQDRIKVCGLLRNTVDICNMGPPCKAQGTSRKMGRKTLSQSIRGLE